MDRRNFVRNTFGFVLGLFGFSAFSKVEAKQPIYREYLLTVTNDSIFSDMEFYLVTAYSIEEAVEKASVKYKIPSNKLVIFCGEFTAVYEDGWMNGEKPWLFKYRNRDMYFVTKGLDFFLDATVHDLCRKDMIFKGFLNKD